MPKPAVISESELHASHGNGVIAQLAVHERNAIHRLADIVPLVADAVLLRAHAVPNLVYFPIDAVVSIVRRMSDGTAIELAIVGPEGLVGVDAFLEVTAQLDDAVVVTRGSAYRIAADDLKNELNRGDGLQRQMLRFAGGFNAQISQNVVCANRHDPVSRLARWLLMVRDRIPARTPIAIAPMRNALAIEQSRVGAAVKRLVASGLVRVGEETISVVDVEGLEATSCECYDVLRERVLTS